MASAEVVLSAKLRVGHHVGDCCQAKVQVSVAQDASQAVEVLVRVDPIAGGAATRRADEAEGVVVVQGSHRDAAEARHLTHRPLSHTDSLPPDAA